MRKLRTLIVDDEPLARDAIRHLLRNDAEIEVAGEASGPDAIPLIEQHRPDILFLDVRMPELDGFALLEAVGVDAVPAVVFVTAYDEYALRAFDVFAIDYLLKPFDDERFALALARAKKRARLGRPDEGVAALIRRESGTLRRFLVRTRDKVLVVNTDEVDWIESADYYALLHVGQKTHIIRRTLKDLEDKLDPERFVRVHRSAIVNLERVREIHPLFHGDCRMILASGAQVKLSRTRREHFERLFTAGQK